MCQVITIFQKKGLSKNQFIHLKWQILEIAYLQSILNDRMTFILNCSEITFEKLMTVKHLGHRRGNLKGGKKGKIFLNEYERQGEFR